MDISRLNAQNAADRLEALRELAPQIKAPERTGIDVNNHIHTTYSFSPYSPTKAVYMSFLAGLSTCGIVDHDSISGAREFVEAGNILSIATTIGFEMRVSMKNSPFSNMKINNPDQSGIAYVLAHGVPHDKIDDVYKFLVPVCAARGERNRAMVEKINNIFGVHGIKIDYDADVLPLSLASQGGSVTERHLLYALSLKLIERYKKGEKLIEFLKSIGLEISKKTAELLFDTDNPCYDYDLLGALKAGLVERIYVDADKECYDIKDFVEFIASIGAISCAPYLGDVGDSVTGDKKPQKFEDDFLDELFRYYKQLGFNGVAYMPSRNTMAQLARVQAMCDELGFIQVSGEDINQPRQKFVCEAARDSAFSGLIDTTWALIGNEKAAYGDVGRAMFRSGWTGSLGDLVAKYKAIGLEGPQNI